MYSQDLDPLKAADVRIVATSREEGVKGGLYGTYVAPLQKHYYSRWYSSWSYHIGCLQFRCPRPEVWSPDGIIPSAARKRTDRLSWYLILLSISVFDLSGLVN